MAREGYKKIAEFMHDRYEFHAKHEGWDTQEKCKVKFADLPEENKRVMLAVAKNVLTYMEEGKHRADPDFSPAGWDEQISAAPMPGPAKDEPAQQHGFKVGDVVGCDAGSGAEITAIVGIKCTLLYGDGIKVIRDATDLTPVHRCRKVVSSHDELGGDECTNRYEHFIAQPGNLLEPFGACSEEPYPVGTWVDVEGTDGFLDWIEAIAVHKGDVIYKLGWDMESDPVAPYNLATAEENVWRCNSNIKEARLPEHEVCKDCGCAFVLPKEESNG